MKRSVIFLIFNIVGFLGLLLLIALKTEGNKFEMTAKEMHKAVQDKDYVITHQELDVNDQVIDIRIPELFRVNPRENSINIPVSDLLNEEYEDLLASDTKKVIVADDPVKTHEAWMLLTQMGYQNLYVLDITENSK